ncbi:hypothetical protein [Brevifollis gellanilyticus]|uniref:Uncharacterized protein n=1 Tax=Brevifollis gellanilyticus TaxID=748831 RepID=A0A512M820_9BACT|nr:hypothetical protein [Brevifollis gellanilyticus]GEP42886.1 hypothetical protein BGE01nite_21770 [Brevifollis gellanilyticus]
MKTPAQQPSALLEALEPRLSPAGIVTVSVAGGVLTLTGDGAANMIEIVSSHANEWQLQDPNLGEQDPSLDTKFVFAGQSVDTAVKDLKLPTYAGLKVVLNGGNDKVDAVNLFTNGPVTLQGGDGDDDMFISGTYNGAVSFDGGNGNDDVGVYGGYINGTVTAKTGAGNDTVYFGSGNYTKGITADLGTGDNVFTLLTDNSLNVFGNISITTAGGATNEQDYYFGIKSGVITGNVTLKTTAGAAYYFLGRDANDALRINGSLNITGSAGADSMLLAGSISIGGALTASLGAGSNGIFNGIDTNNNDATRLVQLTLGSLAYTGGAGRDTVYLECPEVVIGGNVAATMGAGKNAMSFFNSTGTFIGGSLAYTGGTGDDRFDFAGAAVTVGGKFTFKGMGAQSQDAGAANTDSVFIYSDYAVLHTVELIGGATGRDIFHLGVAEGADLNFTSTLISVLGDVITNTGAGYSDVELTDTIVHGKVTHTSAVAASTASDYYFIEDGYVTGALTINAAGAANAQIVINDTLCISTVTITTGAGDDRVDFDTRTTESIGICVFYGAVSISLGTGNDDWVAGWNPVTDTVGNNFRSSVKVDGGTGNNHSYYGRNSNWNNTFVYDPVFLGVMAYDQAVP